MRADAIDPRHPLNLSDYLRGEPGPLGVWQTGTNGHAAVTLLRTRPTSVAAFAKGYLPVSIFIDSGSPADVRVTLTPLTENSPTSGNLR